MTFHRHILRDVFWLTLPLLVVLIVLFGSTVVSFCRAEIANFHGYPVRSLRAGSLKDFLVESLRPLTEPKKVRHLPVLQELNRRIDGPRVFDLRTGGEALDALMSDLPASASAWQPGELVEGGVARKVDVRHRGQRMANYFFEPKAWKIRTDTSELVEDSRTINLTPLHDRLESHLIFLAAASLNLPAPRSRVCQLYLNRTDQGLFLQEEQIDESLIRRTGRMPGDVFYGELFVPDEPPMSCDDLFWNPYLWVKNDRHNFFDEEHRPYLTALLDLVSDDSPESFDLLYELLHMDVFAGHFAVLSFVGDQHIDHSHNHKLYFSPLSGKFDPILWNPLMNMPRGHGLESFANRLFRKLCRDPRFLDRVQRVVKEQLLDAGLFEAQLEELDRIERQYAAYDLDPRAFDRSIFETRAKVTARRETLRGFFRVADLCFCDGAAGEETSGQRPLDLYARSVASLRPAWIELGSNAEGVQLFEDQNFDGALDPGDREVGVRAQGRKLLVEDDQALLFVGRDFRAPYFEDSFEGVDAFTTHRRYTRLAFLKSSYILRRIGGVPEVKEVRADRTVGEGPVRLERGAPVEYVATESVHPWTIPPRPTARTYRFQGTQELRESLIVDAADSFEAAPGTRLLLGPDVSIALYCKVNLHGVRVGRLDPERPWGVIALQGEAASGSVIENCDIEGGSHGVVKFIYYSGMISAHHVDDLEIQSCRFGPNVLGDDTLRFGLCNGLSIRDCRVERAHGDAIDCDLCQGSIVDTSILAPRNDGVDLMTAQVDIQRTQIHGSGDKGVSVGEGAKPEIVGCTIEGCVIGIGIKDGSAPIVRDTVVRGCRSGVASYDKNWRYPGGGKGRLIRCTLEGNDVDIRMDSASTLVLENCVTGGRFRLPPDSSDDQLLFVESREKVQ